MTARLLPAILLFALAACSGRGGDDGPIDVSVIGAEPVIVDPNQKPLADADAVLVGATAQGLIRFDGTGQIEPAAAIRWDVSDDGLYYTFRIDDAAGIKAEDVARRLRVAIARPSRNPLKPVLGAIDEVVAVTPEVVEIRLAAPRPTLLQLLAQPEMGLILSRSRGGSGPLAIDGRGAGTILLRPAGAEQAGEEDEEEDAADRERIRLRGERAALAVARFQAGGAQPVLGGRYQDLAVARAAGLPANILRFDPVAGLFGLQIVEARGFLATPEMRGALSMAVDRDRLVNAFAVKGWRSALTLVPGGIADLPAPTAPGWADIPLAGRRILAAGAVGAWRQQNGGAAPRVRVALPPGPGSRLLFSLIRADWRAIGVEAEMVGMKDDADLRLVDRVAPADSGSWYLREFACDRAALCSEEADRLMDAARKVPALAERNLTLADADARLARVVPFIPLAMPLRWSLVAPALVQFQENARGVHPLNHLRPDRR
ncbi:ABC transporter substrate-binding protein [Edaphosphingomonas haloaromaticamans]|uniref:Bacterial extracellular solute-binding protein, family 5 Middle n=1 Tax=Edaphosphingomonas haloaromaticamans TaxID=653954 RepID=A0A1S1HAK8_9SPHN|nr:ABC transporter substrate-binding protein [Sphingomonas haloaromaticamans]OHT19239.1 Bacterial extracellular solute-binding protein, family 5 Middle [Sphingomonas haloaromaticamans]